MSPASRKAESPGHPPLAIESVAKHFGGITAVDDVSLSAGAGEVVGVIGPNGSGKSTLFSLAAGGQKPDTGKIRLLGIDVTGWPTWKIARTGISRTFQIPSLFINMTVRDNLLAAAVEGDWQNARDRMEDTLEMLEISHVVNNLASELSGGQQKLVEFGRVCMRDPKVILLDEVTAGVHPNIRQIILGAIQRLRKTGITFLVIEHDMEMVKEICDRLVVMDQGKIVAEGDFETIASDTNVQKAYLGRT
ncbi:ABC transporter ATP-binding protein [Marinobacter sp. Arc7-DN-1]|uniref:ABC transporter ATP-binding protein n=1 Tax=Marinobacter sp. Arc7-DN-1 TaxID=2304594 RepID=UPI000E44CB3F|nr:ABC transporter ATP-binding protein [Marinobacter sp. Arc7-DN-1]AXS84053.1 ABC transporter ATP-binding protein [Marinobacter sp. Arc7-DN-1]